MEASSRYTARFHEKCGKQDDFREILIDFYDCFPCCLHLTAASLHTFNFSQFI